MLYFEDRAEIFSAIDPRYDTPPRLWSALAGLPALTFAHHSAGGPIATNWDFPPDPVLEPLTEVSSVHGSSEAADSPRVVADAIAGNFVRDALDRGYRLGFIGKTGSCMYRSSNAWEQIYASRVIRRLSAVFPD